MLTFWLVSLFVLGTVVGSLLNVCIFRLPLEKSILWPASRCGSCLQHIRWYDNIPLVSYLALRGQCRICKASFSPRYFLIELLTGVCFAGLFYLEVYRNIHQFEALKYTNLDIDRGFLPPYQAWIVVGTHALLVSFLIVATFCDLEHREIPLSVTVPGTVLGLIAATLWPWPWPYTPAEALQLMPPDQDWGMVGTPLGPRMGLYPWPFWGPVPSWFSPGGNWQTGFVTGITGALVGTMMLRVIRFLFGLGLGIEALGLGDADLMMMAGSFMGWQPVVVAFFVGVFVGLFFGIGQLVMRGDNMMPFGPSLAVGIVLTFLGWRWIAPQVQPFFFSGILVFALGAISCVLLLILSYVMRVGRLLRQ